MTPEVISAVHTGQTFSTLKKCRQSFLVDKAQHETQPHSWVAEQQRTLGMASLQHTHTTLSPTDMLVIIFTRQATPHCKMLIQAQSLDSSLCCNYFLKTFPEIPNKCSI